MPRARYLKPGFFTNERIGELAPLDRLLWQGLWCQADRDGRLKDNPKRLKIEVMPWDDISVDDALNRLQEAGFVVRYEVDGVRCVHLPSFQEHQHPHPKEPKSDLPAPPSGPVPESPEPEPVITERPVAGSPIVAFRESPEPVPVITERAAKATGLLSERAVKASDTESESESESESGLAGKPPPAVVVSDPERKPGEISERELIATLTAQMPPSIIKRDEGIIVDLWRDLISVRGVPVVNEARLACMGAGEKPYVEALQRHMEPLATSPAALNAAPREEMWAEEGARIRQETYAKDRERRAVEKAQPAGAPS